MIPSLREPLQETLQSARVRARKVLQEDLPGHLRKLQKLLADADNETSPLWLGHLDRGMFLSENVVLTGVADGAFNDKVNSKDGTHFATNGSLTTPATRASKAVGDPDDLENGTCWLGGLERNEVCLSMMRTVER